MFESAELGHKIGKAEYRAAIPALRMALQEAQVAIYEAKIPVILLISGQDGAGKGEIIHSLYEWLDPRFINTLAFLIPVMKRGNGPPCGVTGGHFRPRAGSGSLPVHGIPG